MPGNYRNFELFFACSLFFFAAETSIVMTRFNFKMRKDKDNFVMLQLNCRAVLGNCGN